MVTLAPYDTGGFVVAATFLKDQPVFALGDGTVLLLGDAGEHRVQVHRGGLLAAARAQDGSALVSGGDDGRVMCVTADGVVSELAELPRKWIDIVATGPQNAVAFATGRTAMVRLESGALCEFPQERAVGGVAFVPKGLRIAIARYDGATLQWVNTNAPAQDLAWKGAHMGATFSPDGKYLVTTMQENALHGWRLSDGQDMRMTGYPSKVKMTDWSAKGRYLATSGANAAILWPFFGKTGPMGQQPLQVGMRRDQIVTALACHPREDVVAIGYRDGTVLAARFADSQEAVMRRADGSPVSSLAWDRAGARLVFGTENGVAGVISLE